VTLSTGNLALDSVLLLAGLALAAAASIWSIGPLAKWASNARASRRPE